MTEYKCWQEGFKDDAAKVSGKDPAEAAAEYAKKYIDSSEWPEGWPEEPEWPIKVEVENHGMFSVWPKCEVVPKSAIKEEHRDKYDRVTAVWFYAARDEPITVNERAPGE